MMRTVVIKLIQALYLNHYLLNTHVFYFISSYWNSISWASVVILLLDERIGSEKFSSPLQKQSAINSQRTGLDSNPPWPDDIPPCLKMYLSTVQTNLNSWSQQANISNLSDLDIVLKSFFILNVLSEVVSLAHFPLKMIIGNSVFMLFQALFQELYF